MAALKNKYQAFNRILLLLLLLTSLPFMALAQGDPPADGCDPYDGCNVPLDNWVLLLAIVAIAYGAYSLHNKQQELSA